MPVLGEQLGLVCRRGCRDALLPKGCVCRKSTSGLKKYCVGVRKKEYHAVSKEKNKQRGLEACPDQHPVAVGGDVGTALKSGPGCD